MTNFTGSETTKSLVEKQIRERWGDAEVKNYDATKNTRTFKSWLGLGFRVRKNEKALRSIIYVEAKDKKGNIIKKICRPVFLFYWKQVEKISSGNYI